jgi:hypothetical protein
MYIYIILHTVHSEIMKKITISYPEEQYKWLENHPEINKSGLFRTVVGYMMKKEKSTLSLTDLNEISECVREL